MLAVHSAPPPPPPPSLRFCRRPCSMAMAMASSAAGGGSSPPSLKSRLAQGERLYGAFLCSASPTMAEILGWCGYDYVVVDMEHGEGGAAEAMQSLRALRAAGASGVLRVAANEAAQVKKAMDLGPEGIMVPMVETAAEAEAAVAACRYAPRGIRGAAHPVVRASRYGIDPGYLSRCDAGDHILLILQIESPSAVESIRDIAAVDGVDCLMIGPTDLSAGLGLLHAPGHPLVKDLQLRAERAVLSSPSRVYLAGFAMGPHDPPHQLFARGCHLVSGSVDVALFRNAALADVAANKPRK